MQLRTHLKIDKSLSGEVVELSEGYAKLRLKTDSRMVADDMGLVHGGFIFSLADFCQSLNAFLTAFTNSSIFL